MSPRLLLIAALFSAFPAGGAQAGTRTVTNTSDGPAPGPAGSLRRAISDAAPGETINFALPANTTINLIAGELLINKNLTISGPGANKLTVQRSAATGTPGFLIFKVEATGTVTFFALTISNGDARGSEGLGGGISILQNGTVNVANCTISGNTADGGGGIATFGNTVVNVTNSTLSGNTAGQSGGGIATFNGGVLNVRNSTISGNSCGSFGGGIASSGATLNITNSTISGNSVTGSDLEVGGGGIANYNGPANVRNTIIARNTVPGSHPPDFQGELTSQGYNVIGNTSGTIITGVTTGNKLNVDPLLGPLQDNGGPTLTHALLSGSPAIEGGNSSGSNTDQCGFARPVDSLAITNATGGDGSDIGAYEMQADLLPGCSGIDRVVTNNDDSGTGSLRDVIANVCAGSTVTFAPNVRGAINLTSGELLINKSLTISGPGANLLSVQRSAAAGTANFRIFRIAPASVIATISGLKISNGNTTAGGGGIRSDGALTLINATLSGNRARNGGGIWNELGTLIIANSTLSGNTVSDNLLEGSGGGIFTNGGTAALTNSTVSGNTAIGPGGTSDSGGGIFSNFGTVTLTSSTVTGNGGDLGGGVRNIGGTLILRNTLIALNTSPSGPDCNGALTSEGFNLIGNIVGAGISPAHLSDQIGVTAAQLSLGPLQNNGGATLTHALLSGSRAIDKGHSSGLSADQRGFTRPADSPTIPNANGGDGGDIGAFEFGSAISLKILSITRAGNGPVVLQVAGVPHAVHRIQASGDFSSGSFLDVATVTADGDGRFQYQQAVTGLVGFLRVAFP